MLPRWIRTFFLDNGVINDFSLSSQNRESYTLPIVAAQDSIIVGQYWPFNNFFIETDVVNDQASNILIDYWNGRDWAAAVDIIDGTKSGSNTFGKSGSVQFSPDRQNGWSLISDTSSVESTFGMTSVVLYTMYFIRIRFSGNLKATTSIKTLSYSFTNDRMLESIDPEIDNYKTAWGGVSKTNWIEQILVASEHVVFDLKKKGLVVGSGNILRFDDVSLACTYRTLINIYAMLGKDFVDKRENSQKEYDALLDIKRFTFDKNENGRVDRSNLVSTIAQGVR